MPFSLTSALRNLSTAPLQNAFAVSIIVHGLVLWAVLLIPPYQPSPLISVDVHVSEPSDAPPGNDTAKASEEQAAITRPRPRAGTAPAAPVRGTNTGSGEASGTGEASSGGTLAGLGNAETDSSGLAIGGGSSGSGVGPPGKGGQETGGQPNTGQSGGQGGAAAKGSRPAVIPPIVIPPSISGSTASHEGAVYFEVDVYVLFAPGATMGVSVPGNEICREGNRIRTIVPFESVEKKTDISKCQILEYGEDRREECLAGAHSVVRSSYHLSSPVNYSVNSCLVYDRSSCDWRDEGDGREQQVCKAPSPYEGIWAADTQFTIAVPSGRARPTRTRCNIRFASFVMLNFKSAQSPDACCFENLARSYPVNNATEVMRLRLYRRDTTRDGTIQIFLNIGAPCPVRHIQTTGMPVEPSAISCPRAPSSKSFASRRIAWNGTTRTLQPRQMTDQVSSLPTRFVRISITHTALQKRLFTAERKPDSSEGIGPLTS